MNGRGCLLLFGEHGEFNVQCNKVVFRDRRLPAHNVPSVRKTVVAVAVAALAATIPPLESPAAAQPSERFAGLLTDIPAEQQIQLAMSAAPAEISRHATILVLLSTGYAVARAGTNGFTCLVERQYLETLEPSCYDAEGNATTLQARLYREELRVAGMSEAEIESRISDRYKAGIFKAPGKPGLVYMLSAHNRVYNDRTKKIIHAPPHLMFYAPYATQKDFGEFVGPHVPYVVLEGRPDAYLIVNPALIAAALPQPASAVEADTDRHSHGK
jgi:hypothetical protein